MKKIAIIITIIFSLFGAFIPDRAQGQGDGDEILFIQMHEADVLFILDISGSMRHVPAGPYMYIDSTTSCGSPCESTNVANNKPFYARADQVAVAPAKLVHIISSSSDVDTITSGGLASNGCSPVVYDSTEVSNVPKWGNADCSGPAFYKQQQPGFTTNCRRIAIAKQAIFNFLDANGDLMLYNYPADGKTIDHPHNLDPTDYNELCLRTGYMRFFQCQTEGSGNCAAKGTCEALNESTSSYNDPCNTLRIEINKDGQNYCNFYGVDPSTSNTNLNNGDKDKKNIPLSGECSSEPRGTGRCAGGTALAASLREAQTYFSTGAPAGDGRNKYVILITDGLDNMSCYPGGNGRDGCAWLDTLTSQYLRNRHAVDMAKKFHDPPNGYTLYVVGFGGDLPAIAKNTLNWMAYYGNPVPLIPSPAYVPSATPCVDEHSTNCFLYSEVSIGNPVTNCNPNTPNPTLCNSGDQCYCFGQAANSDPANTPLSGYAYVAKTANELGDALHSISQSIIPGSYGFTAPAVPTVRMVDNDRLYLSTLSPNETAFWPGTFLGYTLKPDGTVNVNANGTIADDPTWKAKIPASRTILTYSGNFDSVTMADLAVGTPAEQTALISYVRNRPLGDIFHSNPVIVGSPSPFFVDTSDTTGSLASYLDFYNTWKTRKKLIIAGANEGMLHAFDVNTAMDTPNEVWAFIPKSVLGNLKYSDPDPILDASREAKSVRHHYFVDSSPRAADVWIDKNGDGTKTADEWRTYLVTGLRKGGKTYFALDITDTSSTPVYKWEFPKTAAILNQVGQSWSEPVIGRVKIEQGGNLVEKWVAFIGGGFDSTNTVGKTFFIIDIETGGDNFFKQFKNLPGMNFSFASPPMPVDVDLDGFVNKVYIGDLGGQMWVFDVSFNASTKESNSKWTGSRLFAADTAAAHPIYYEPSVVFDNNRTPWVFFGTGDRENPNAVWSDHKYDERFYAVKDDMPDHWPPTPYATPRVEGNLKDVTSVNTFTPPDTQKGWFMKLGLSEKVLSRPTVFSNLLYFTTYTYPKPGDPFSPCSASPTGSGKAYIVDYLSGGGATDEAAYMLGNPSARTEDLGVGVPSAPTISVNLRGEASITIRTSSDKIFSKKAHSAPAKEILYWREVVH